MYIGKIAGIKLKISSLFFLLMVTMGFFNMLVDGIIIFFVVVVHELGHVFVAKGFQYNVTEIELLPIGGVATIDQSVYNHSSHEWYISVAGPLNNLIFIIIIMYFSKHIPYGDKLLGYNLSLFFFNLLPAYPLDGGRILKAFLSKSISLIHAQKIAILVGIIIGIIFLFLSGYYLYISQDSYLYLGILGFFLLISAIKELNRTKFLPVKLGITKMTSYEKIREGKTIICTKETKIKDIIKEVETNRELIVYIVDDNGEVIDVLTEFTIINAFNNGKGSKSVITLLDVF